MDVGESRCDPASRRSVCWLRSPSGSRATAKEGWVILQVPERSQSRDERALVVLRLNHSNHHRQFLRGLFFFQRNIEQKRNGALSLKRKRHAADGVFGIQRLNLFIVVRSPAWQVLDHRT